MMTRRAALKSVLAIAGAAAASAEALAAAKRYEPQVTDDGLYSQPWFMQTFLDLPEDFAEAAQSGKRFVVLWEQKGCPYCKEMHQVNLARPDIHEYVRDNFAILQLNLWGSREVTDFDGNTTEERKLARKWRVNFTPTVQFFPPALEAGATKPGVDLEVARMPGYFKPFHFMSMFEFVEAKAYESSTFQRFLQRKLADFEAKGIDPDVW